MRKIISISLTALVLAFTSIFFVRVNAADAADLNVTVNVMPTISLTADTNSIDFGNISSSNADNPALNTVNLTVFSNGLFNIVGLAADDLIGTKDNLNVITIDNLKAKVTGDTTWVSMSKTTPAVIKGNQSATTNGTYNLMFILTTTTNTKSDQYSTMLNLAVDQL